MITQANGQYRMMHVWHTNTSGMLKCLNQLMTHEQPCVV